MKEIPTYGKSLVIAFLGMGIVVEKQLDTPELLTLYISVPEHSLIINAHGEEMSGRTLALRFKKLLQALGLKNLKLLSKIRVDETWTNFDRERAEAKYQKILF